MAFNFTNSNVSVREHRLGSITGYSGELKTLSSKTASGTLRNRERCFSQSSSCLSACALGVLAGIRNIAIIYHAPSGCAALAASTEVTFRQIAARVNKKNNTVFVCSDLNENDTVFGAINHLKGIVKQTYENYHPDAIFVSGSCASGVIGEDIDSLVNELQDQYPVPVVPIHCEGFKSRIWATGFDIGDHAILQGIVKPPKEKRNVINLKNFFESGRKEVEALFAEFGIGVQMLYCNSTIEELSHLSESLATVSICSTLSTYLGNALQEKYGVPYIQTNAPVGIKGFEEWLRQIGKAINISDKVEAYIERQRAKYNPELEKLVDVAAETEKKALIGAKRFGEEAMGFGTQGVNPTVENGYTKMDDLIKDAKGVKENLDKYSAEIDKIEAAARARREAEMKAAQANAQPAQQEQLVPMEIEEDGPKMSM